MNFVKKSPKHLGHEVPLNQCFAQFLHLPYIYILLIQTSYSVVKNGRLYLISHLCNALIEAIIIMKNVILAGIIVLYDQLTLPQ